MSKIYVTIYTEENGKQQLTYEQWRACDQSKVTYHRVDGPAIEYADGTKEWYLNDKLHRANGPAKEYADGTKHWYLDGKLHRANGPAVERANGDKIWYLNGKRHRANGPATEWADGGKYWWLNGKNYTEKDYSKTLKEVKARGKFE